MASDTISAPAPVPFRHEALLYAGTSDFVERIAAFVQTAIVAGEPTYVVVDAAKIELLRDVLGPDTPGVEFADMAEVGRNPAQDHPGVAHLRRPPPRLAAACAGSANRSVRAGRRPSWSSASATRRS